MYLSQLQTVFVNNVQDYMKIWSVSRLSPQIAEKMQLHISHIPHIHISTELN